MVNNFNQLNIFNRERLLINKYIALQGLFCNGHKFNLFDITIPDEVQTAVRELNAEKVEIISQTNREGFTCFHNFIDENQNRMFIYTTLFCKKSGKAVITFNVSGSGKVWLNGKCIYGYVNEYCWSSRALEVDLICGTNIIMAEMDTIDTENVFNMTVSDYEYENSSDILALVNTDFRIYPTTSVVWLSDNDFLPVERNFCFMLFQSAERFEKNFEIEIYDWKFACIDRFDGCFDSMITVVLDKYRSPDEPYNMKNIMVKCLLKDRMSGELFSSEKIVYISELRFALNNITIKADDIANKQPKIISDNIKGKINMLKNAYEYNEYARVYWGLRQMNDLIYKVENNEIDELFYTRAGNHDFYIYSDLDDSYVNIKSHIPESYDKQKSMPVFFALATSKEGYFTQRMDFTKLNEDCLCFDITGRGYTSGSYIGEASIMELINWTLYNYNIDKTRMYLLGYSNGGFATWSIVQNHPDMFAAIFPLAGLSSKISNSKQNNYKVFQIISSSDYLYSKQKDFVEIWKNSDDHTLYFADDMLHVSMYPQLTNCKIINEMLKCKRSEPSNLSNGYIKSYGMLKVYSSSMRIIIDDFADEIMTKTAEKLAKPTSSGMNPEIDVDYPIYKSSNLPTDIYKHNLIYMQDISKKNKLFDAFRRELVVECLSDGFIYKQEKYLGDYVYMQFISQQPDNKAMLAIITNNEKLLNKHILLRKVVIPSYYSGFHPYWNQNGLLYYNNKYEAVK